MNGAPLLNIEYVLPLRWTTDETMQDLTAYLTRLRVWADVTVVDGSEPDCFALHASVWSDIVRHIPCDDIKGANGKVRGVLTGIACARHEHVVIADDDVRYDYRALTAVVSELERAALVKPQNHFAPLPWHARWDTARSLLNRAVSVDYPGTYALRRSALLRTGGYDADTLFENLEMERTIRAAGGRVRTRSDIYVERRPPTARHFLSQRVRQAYDSWAQPSRLVIEASILPVVLILRRRPGALMLMVLAIVLLAERGRRRFDGRSVFPATSAFWAPLWVAERAVCSWLAIAARLRGGVRYGGARITVAAHSPRRIRRRIAGMAKPRRSPIVPAAEER